MKAILFVDNEAVCAALTNGAAKNKVALMLVFVMWSLAAQYCIALGAERVPSEVNPAYLRSRGKELSFKTEPRVDLVTATKLFAMCDLSRMLQRTD